MMNYADKVRKEENELIYANREVIDAFLTILEKRVVENYYNTKIAGEQQKWVDRMEACRVVHQQLENIVAMEETNREGA